jgi:hypothetical protein
VYYWSVEKVCQCIRRIESVYEDKKYDSMFRENGIDGFAVMNIEKCKSRRNGNSSLGERIKIMVEIKKLK